MSTIFKDIDTLLCGAMAAHTEAAGDLAGAERYFAHTEERERDNPTLAGWEEVWIEARKDVLAQQRWEEAARQRVLRFEALRDELWAQEHMDWVEEQAKMRAAKRAAKAAASAEPPLA